MIKLSKTKRLLAGVTAAAMAISVAAFSPLLSFAVDNTSSLKFGSTPTTIQVYDAPDVSDGFITIVDMSTLPTGVYNYGSGAYFFLWYDAAWTEIAYTGSTRPDILDSDGATSITFNHITGEPASSFKGTAANSRTINAYGVNLVFFDRMTSVTVRGESYNLNVATNGVFTASVTQTKFANGAALTPQVDRAITSLNDYIMLASGEIHDTVVTLTAPADCKIAATTNDVTADQVMAKSAFGDTATVTLGDIGLKRITVQVLSNDQFDEIFPEPKSDPIVKPTPEPANNQNGSTLGGGVATGGGGTGGGVKNENANTSAQTPISDPTQAANVIKGATRGTVSVAPSTGATTEVLAALENANKNVNVWINYGNVGVKINGSQVTGGNLKDLNFAASVVQSENAPAELQALAATLFPGKTVLGMEFAQSGDFGSVSSVTLSVRVPSSLSGKPVDVYSMTATGLVRVPASRLVSGAGVINVQISNFNNLIFVV